MDVSEYCRQILQDKYKSRGSFGTNRVQTRIQKTTEHRKERRGTLLDKMRHIPENLTPIGTPEEQAAQKVPQQNRRLLMLQKWKEAKKQKKIEEGKKKKPDFKVCHLPKYNDDLFSVYNNIKGRPIKKVPLPENTEIRTTRSRGISSVPTRTHELVFQPTAVLIPHAKPAASIDKKKIMKKTPRVTNPWNEHLFEEKIQDQVTNGIARTKHNGSSYHVNTPKLKSSKANKKQLSKESEEKNNDNVKNIKKFLFPKQETNHNVDEVPDQSNKKIDKGESIKQSRRILRTPKKTSQNQNQNGFLTDEEEYIISPVVKSKNRFGSLVDSTRISRKKKNLTLTSSSIGRKSSVKKNTKKANESEKRKKSETEVFSKNESSASSDYPMNGTDSDTEDANSHKTPSKTPDREIADEVPVYISPFVTISRGKDRARKEYESRNNLTGDQDILSSKDLEMCSPKAAASYFSRILDNEVKRIIALCNEWTTYKESDNVPEEAGDMIDMAIGQSNLLVTSKFQQFRGLIEQSSNSNSSQIKIRCEELHGFWDLVSIQVEDLNKRFAYLTTLKANDWLEIIPIQQEKKKQVKRPTKKSKATSTVREAIKEAKMKRKALEQNVNSSTLHIENFSPERHSTAKKTPRSTRKSLLHTVLSNQASRRLSSPGLTMMKISQSAKALEFATPGKGILKTDESKSNKRMNKSVLFKDAQNESEGGKENEIPNLICFSPVEIPTPTRKSIRLSRLSTKKLF